jgi:hypothetical protein
MCIIAMISAATAINQQFLLHVHSSIFCQLYAVFFTLATLASWQQFFVGYTKEFLKLILPAPLII